MSRSLGTLTLDLVAKVGGFVAGMDQAERSSAKWRKQVEKDAKALGSATGAAAAAVVASLTAMTVATAKQAAEIQKLAGLSGVTNESFQRFAAGAKLVGIEQEKLGDIFKDVQDKVGDFLQTGGGAMADFFENIAPKVGVTAEQFRKLSGPEALGLYVSSLEKAGASQQEMVFYLEAIASDATALLPLLKNNSAGFTELGQAAADAGAIMSDKTIRAANEMAAVAWQAENAFLGIRNQVSAGLLPVLSDLSTAMMGVSTNSAIAEDAGRTLGNVIKGLAATAYGAYAAFDILGKGIGASMAIVAAADFSALDIAMGPAGIANRLYQNSDQIKRALTVTGEDLQKTIDQHATVLNGIWEAGAGGDSNTATKRIADLLEQQRKLYESLGTAGGRAAGGIDEATKAAERQAEAIQKELTALERAAAVWGMSADEVKIYDLRLKGATESQVAYAQSILDAVAAAEAQKEINDQVGDILDSLKSEEQLLRESYERRKQIIIDSTILAEEEKAAALLKLNEGLNEELLEGQKGYWEQWLEGAEESLTSFDELAGSVIENFSGRFGDAFEAMVFDSQSLSESIQGLAEGMARSVINALGQMAAQWLAYQAVQLLVGKTTQASAVTATAGNAYAGVMLAGINAFASTAAIPIVGPVAAPAAMTAAIAATTPMAAAATTYAMMGMAHDGIMSVPKTGTWLLEKGERVTTAETSAKLDGMLDRAAKGDIGRGSVNQNIYVEGRVDRRTSMQIAAAADRSQRRAIARLG